MNKPDKKYGGVIVPMVSPVNKDYSIDHEAIDRIIDTFVRTGVKPFLLGTTGESVSLSIKQKYDLVKHTASACKNKCELYVGISGNSLFECIEESIRYFELGVQAVVAHLPFYYPVNNDQMLRYYEQLANSVPCPLFLYNNPITTNISIPLEVIEKLSYHENIAGVKDSERGMERLDASLQLWANRSDFVHLLGWAAKSAYALLKGSDGIVPSTGNITPGLYADLYEAALDNNQDTAMTLQEKTDQISAIYQKDRKLNQSLAALKVMMSYYGLCQEYVLPPLYELSVEEHEKIKEMMVEEMGQLI